MKFLKNNYLYLLLLFIFSALIVFGSYRGGFSKGSRYFSRLSLWYTLAAKNEWDRADKLEVNLDPADTITYKATHRPAELKKYINNLTLKPNKSVEDWLELARIQSILGKGDDAYTSISTAKSLDPIRDDIGQIYYQTSK
jgi:hypothetical protein